MLPVNSFIATKHPASKASLNWAPVFILSASVISWLAIAFPFFRMVSR